MDGKNSSISIAICPCALCPNQFVQPDAAAIDPLRKRKDL
jgi:hypothetical protein